MRLKISFLLLFVSTVSYALDDVSKPFNFGARDTIKASRMNANYDTLYSRVNQTNDSIDLKFIRFLDLNSGDSTLKRLQIDTIRSNPNVDSVTGNLVIVGSPKATGTLTADTIGSTKGISASRFYGPVTGAITGNVTGSISGGTVAGSTGTYTGLVTVDSLASTKGISGTYGRFSGPVSGTTGTYSSTVGIDSLAVTKGVTVGNNIVGTNASALNILTNTSDGSDNKFLQLCGGGAGSETRGAFCSVFGNEHATYPGRLSLGGGNGSVVGPIVFSTKNTERLRIDSLGNVGIGTSSPAYRLHIQSSGAGTVPFRIDAYDGSNLAYLYEAPEGYAKLLLRDAGGTERVSLQASDTGKSYIAYGNFGIGTTSPSAKLHISGGLIRGDSLRLANYASVDSLNSTKSCTAPRGRFDSLIAPIMTGNVITRGRINADTIASTKGVSGTYGRFSSIVYGDSIASTKGITATTGTFSGALASTTLNTGNGDNELYAMNQNVTTTSDPTFDSLRTRVTYSDSGNIPILKSATTIRGALTVDSLYSATKGIKVGSTVIDTGFYKEGFFPCTSTSYTPQLIDTCYYIKSGKAVTLQFKFKIFSGSRDSSEILYRGVPSFLQPSTWGSSLAWMSSFGIVSSAVFRILIGGTSTNDTGVSAGQIRFQAAITRQYPTPITYLLN